MSSPCSVTSIGVIDERLQMKLVEQKKIKKLSDRRKKHNLDLIKRMQDGESLTSFDSSASWFPPRPVIRKDAKALARLYKKGKNSGEGEESESLEAGQASQSSESDSASVSSLALVEDNENSNS